MLRTVSGTLKNIYDRYGFSKTGETNNRNRSGIFNWSKNGINRWVQNPVLCGHTIYNKSKIVGKKRLCNSPQEWEIISNTHLEQRLMTDEELEPRKSDRLIELEEQLKVAESFPGFNINNEKLKTELRQQITDEINLSCLLANQTVEEIIRTGNNVSFR